ncbi:peptide/nickel transport system permease protein [Pseudochelatococcus lubricantis]|uniref:Peptide/nickel transport system permease protein n=1 Tax=Pseudochelatococcus lubricantis TaxID=1538102 RepID=A0ABX0V3G8_9HYPH|nr:ABC transporter permease [Pseudochelatococcus lubricantis]NIJ59677.1 peptide/nickel transport system permease protein [Pseudochelatococcus lubricantis]
MTKPADQLSVYPQTLVGDQLLRFLPSADALRTVPATVYAAGVVVAFFLVAAVAPSLLQTHDPFRTDLYATLQSPSLDHFFGTDQSGRDLYSRVVQGTGQSLAIGLGAIGLSIGIALLVGVTAGLAGRRTDAALSRFLDVLLAFPNLFLALLFVAVFGATTTTLIVSVGLGCAPGYARLIRGQFLVVRNSGYVEAARALGHPYGRIVRQHIFPNAMRPLIVMITMGVGQTIVWASSLAFLGLGVAPPSPEWGALLDAGRNYVTVAWWLEVMPGFAIILFALSVTVIGQHLQDRLEGRVNP